MPIENEDKSTISKIIDTQDQQITLNLNITGMTCANCALKISTTLQNLPGIKQADVSLTTENAKVLYDKNQINIDQILQSVEDIGYHADSFKSLSRNRSAMVRE